MRILCSWFFVLYVWSASSSNDCHAWIPSMTTYRCHHHQHHHHQRIHHPSRILQQGTTIDTLPVSSLVSSSSSSSISFSSSTRLYATLPDGYQEFGEHLIRNAGRLCGLKDDTDLSIEWKADRIVVTVHAQSYVSADEEQLEDMDSSSMIMDMDGSTDIDMELDMDFTGDMEINDVDDDDDTVAYDEDDDDDDNDEENPLSKEESLGPETEEASSGGIDVAVLARAINAALDDGGIGLAIAETHEIEVTTPGAPDELQGPIMFNAYKGFDVICQQEDTKTKKVKQIEGRLVERNSEFTVINVKGRIKKMKNSTVLSVKLPKAKKEKGK